MVGIREENAEEKTGRKKKIPKTFFLISRKKTKTEADAFSPRRFQYSFRSPVTPTTLSLLAFAYASAYFTGLIYVEPIQLRRYWHRKLVRLGPRLAVIDLFLLGLFLWQQRPGIWSWQSLVNASGFQGILNWFGLPNPSPFGRGMWFLTLLLLFYAAYPLLAVAYRRRGAAILWTLAWFCAAWLAQLTLPQGHALWLTTCGFAMGLLASRTGGAYLTSLQAGFGAVLFLITVGILNAIRFPALNFWLLLGLFAFAIQWWHRIMLPGLVLQACRPFRGCVLEIYLIHPYLLIQPTGWKMVDVVWSIAIVLATAKVLEAATTRLWPWLIGYCASSTGKAGLC